MWAFLTVSIKHVILDRNITMKSILVTNDWRAQLTDFSRICNAENLHLVSGVNQTQHAKNDMRLDETEVQFMSPEMWSSVKKSISEKEGGNASPGKRGAASVATYDMASDIFSFGIVVCGLICDRDPSSGFLRRASSLLPAASFKISTSMTATSAIDEKSLSTAASPGCPEGLVSC